MRSRGSASPPLNTAEVKNSVSSIFPSPQSRRANFALPAEVSAKALTDPERDLEEEIGQFPLSFFPSPSQLLRSFGKVASKHFLQDRSNRICSAS